jgi:hypothetical protein
MVVRHWLNGLTHILLTIIRPTAAISNFTRRMYYGFENIKEDANHDGNKKTIFRKGISKTLPKPSWRFMFDYNIYLDHNSELPFRRANPRKRNVGHG